MKYVTKVWGTYKIELAPGTTLSHHEVQRIRERFNRALERSLAEVLGWPPPPEKAVKLSDIRPTRGSFKVLNTDPNAGG